MYVYISGTPEIVPSLEQPRQALPTIPEASLSNPAGPLKHYASSWNEPAGDSSRMIICSLWGRGSVNGREIGVGKWWWQRPGLPPRLDDHASAGSTSSFVSQMLFALIICADESESPSNDSCTTSPLSPSHLHVVSSNKLLVLWMLSCKTKFEFPFRILQTCAMKLAV
ncbi:hypothetical protein C8R48DRAFT_766026 [Suillus tomentosus]|nr:hypothetical protein C8R48DRAFT_766026 [Suillus tomentosus]